MRKYDFAGKLTEQNIFIKIASLSWLKKNTIIEIIALLLVILFLYTGISKLLDYPVFKEQLAESPVLKPVAPIIAWLLPSTEFVVSILLFIPRFRLKGLYAALGLMVLFTGYIIFIMNFSQKLPCSCGGILEALSWSGHLIFNSVFVALAVVAIVLARRLQQNSIS